LIKEERITNRDIRFFIGHSGLGEGQLDEEMKQKSWIVLQVLILKVRLDLLYLVLKAGIGAIQPCLGWLLATTLLLVLCK